MANNDNHHHHHLRHFFLFPEEYKRIGLLDFNINVWIVKSFLSLLTILICFPFISSLSLSLLVSSSCRWKNPLNDNVHVRVLFRWSCWMSDCCFPSSSFVPIRWREKTRALEIITIEKVYKSKRRSQGKREDDH